jgi:imidazoleglycerol phosphate dehydratase HisB
MRGKMKEERRASMRTASINRKTNETDIRIELDLDGSGQHDISTGVGFLDHMLTHIAVHGLFDLTVKAAGDLHIDVHHTVEDVALVLGSAFDQALGDRKGIVRMASFYAPMDETLAFVALDLSGRPYSVIEAEWGHPRSDRSPPACSRTSSRALPSMPLQPARPRALWPRRPPQGRSAIQGAGAGAGCGDEDR